MFTSVGEEHCHRHRRPRNGRLTAASLQNQEEGDPEDIESFIQVAWDALVFIVPKTNPVSNIPLEDVRAYTQVK